MRVFAAAAATFLALAFAFAAPAASSGPGPDDLAVPRYKHIFVIMGENKDWSRIDGSTNAPRLTQFAKAYGDATRFYGEVHPSEANYVALLGGRHLRHPRRRRVLLPCRVRRSRPAAGAAGPATSTIRSTPRTWATQLDAAGLTWKGYYESLPAPGSLAMFGARPGTTDGTRKTALYASKHSGFINFASVQNDPRRAEQIVGFDRPARATSPPATAAELRAHRAQPVQRDARPERPGRARRLRRTATSTR